MYNRGEYKNRVYFSHGDFTEGFMFTVYPKNLVEGETIVHQQGTDTGWFKIKGKLLKEFNRALNTGKFREIELTDDNGQKFKFSVTEIKMLQDEYIDHCFERLSDTSERQKRKIVKSIGLAKLAKAAGAL